MHLRTHPEGAVSHGQVHKHNTPRGLNFIHNAETTVACLRHNAVQGRKQHTYAHLRALTRRCLPLLSLLSLPMLLLLTAQSSTSQSA